MSAIPSGSIRVGTERAVNLDLPISAYIWIRIRFWFCLSDHRQKVHICGKQIRSLAHVMAGVGNNQDRWTALKGDICLDLISLALFLVADVVLGVCIRVLINDNENPG
jgi:hypothetical protein